VGEDKSHRTVAEGNVQGPHKESLGGIEMRTRRLDHKTFCLGRRARVVGTVIVVVALVTSACSSSSKSASSATTTAKGTQGTSAGGATGTSTGASGGDIVIGGVNYGANFPDTAAGFQARINRFNTSGGLNGRKIKFLGTTDDNGTVATDQSIVQSLVLNDHVIALAPVNTTAFGPASSDFAAQNHTPFFSWSYLPNECGSQWSYGFNGCLVGSKVLNSSLEDPIISVVGDPKKVRLAIQQNDNPSGISSETLFTKLITARGGQAVYAQANIPSSGTVDYTPYVQAILKTNPNVVFLGTIFPQTVGMSAALKAAGYKGAIQDYESYVPGLLAQQPAIASALQGQYVNTQVPPQESQSPAIKQMETDLAAIGKPTQISISEQIGYWIGDVLVEMLQATAAAGRPLTGDGLYQTANSGTFTYTPKIDGGVGPEKFPDAENNPSPCAALVQVTGTQYKMMVPFKCYENLPNQ
jgi:branched-chain amino acid transport system substrate-binding protein